MCLNAVVPRQRQEKCIDNDRELKGNHGNYLWEAGLHQIPQHAVDRERATGVEVGEVHVRCRVEVAHNRSLDRGLLPRRLLGRHLHHGFCLYNSLLLRSFLNRLLFTHHGRLQVFNVDRAMQRGFILLIWRCILILSTVQDHLTIKRVILVVSKFSSSLELVLLILILLMLERIIIFQSYITSYSAHYSNDLSKLFFFKYFL